MPSQRRNSVPRTAVNLRVGRRLNDSIIGLRISFFELRLGFLPSCGCTMPSSSLYYCTVYRNLDLDKIRRTEARGFPDVICLRRILGLRWFDFVSNASVMNQTQQRSICSRIRDRRFTMFGHVRRLCDRISASSWGSSSVSRHARRSPTRQQTRMETSARSSEASLGPSAGDRHWVLWIFRCTNVNTFLSLNQMKITLFSNCFEQLSLHGSLLQSVL